MEATSGFQEYLVFVVHGIQYIAWPYLRAKTSALTIRERDLVFVISVEAHGILSKDWVKSILDYATERDDVFCLDFLSGVILVGEDRKDYRDRDVQAFLSSAGNVWMESVNPGDLDKELLPGPYVLQNGSFWKVARLYEDTAEAFTVGLQTLPDKSILPLQVHGTGQKAAIAVPSRLPSCSKTRRPLSGYRITVKEIFDVRGLKTGLGSRAYTELYPPASQTAPAVQKLIDAGADLIGISKMCSMVLKAPPTQCIDVSAPFNPRGDGYLSPSGGSSGQATAVAAYEWVDFAIGSDSTFSGRMPAQANGCFALRPTVGCLPTQGMWSGVPQFDTPCLFGRDISRFEHFAGVWYGEKLGKPVMDTHRLALISSPEHFTSPASARQQIFKDLVEDLGLFLGVRTETISIVHLWERNPPLEAGGEALMEYLNEEVATRSYIYSFWQKISSFSDEYISKFGKTPFLPPPKGIHLWDRARTVSPAQHEESLARLSVYKTWLLETYLQSGRRDAILVLPLEEVLPLHRDEWPGEAASDQQLWEPLLVAPIVGAPEIVIPAGTIHYDSKISGRQEPLPVCVSIMGLPGSDLQLIRMACDFLAQTGRPTKVNVGRHTFANDA